MNQSRRSLWLLSLALTCLVSASLAAQPPVQVSFELPPAGEEAPAPRALVSAPTLSLDQLLAQAAQHHPDLAVARSRVEVARGDMIQAGLWPNPFFLWQGDVMTVRTGPAGNQGPIISQPIPTAHKLKLAQAAAQHGVVAAEWQATTRWYDVVTRIRLAWYEALTVQGEVEVNQEIVRIAEESLKAARKLQEAGAGTQPDILQAQVELDQGRLQLVVARQRLDTARKLLATAAGLLACPVGDLLGTVQAPAPCFEFGPVLAIVQTQSSEIHEALSNILRAEGLLQKAVADRVPDALVTVRPFYSDPNNQMLVRVEAGIGLPIFNRNQGNIHAAQAQVPLAHQQLKQVELSLTERLSNAFQRYRAAREQREAYDQRILPAATESLRLVRLGYERGDPKYEYVFLLQAQRTLVQARLAAVRAAGEVWKASSEIEGLLQVPSKK